METWNDDRLVEAVESALHNEPHLDGVFIQVGSCRGVLTLSGIVHSAAQRERAAYVARNFGGVEELRNELQISP